MDYFAKAFTELTTSEVYEIIKARQLIFLLEQNITCLDLDGVDYHSLHCYISDGQQIQAYLRAFPSQDHENTVTIGRVLTLHHGKGLGKELIKQSIPRIKNTFGCSKINLHSQKSAAEFYKKMGFKSVSGEFMEAGIAHVMMEMEL